ncbi:hypothetical protein [Maritalea mediterranea]|uniref:Secreted protein n=1 Tax=Maritalea mediterranea TaxID=2909667 RepID=A0ABS9ECS9_9HYPH|nr:hypothetical protein [Maritalea mediterranea]MCF4099984.1 hypothetical protein [Maritalea mediterranea]
MAQNAFKRLALSGLLMIGVGTTALAADIDVAYTDTDLTQCTIINADDFGATFACPGWRGVPVMIAEGDLRFFVSYGLNAADEKAAYQTLGPFNTIGQKIEWRLTNRTGDWRPYATILRYYTDNEGGPEGQTLVVTKIDQGNTCQIARVDARKYKNANQIARDLADAMAFDFDCANEPVEYGG